ncbi:MAG: hypothetical protein NZT92_10335 [Abditibacteriales bacterium]|nr:hypothetical protein [Abditibacteriales bacterium]MDW8366351.1 hypothetical protein [Abditibacteriales bacterium]
MRHIPIALLVDDSCPLVHVLRFHWEDVHHREPVTKDGRRMLDYIPNSFLEAYCDVCDRWGIAGKFSIVPAPAGRGDVVNGIQGFPPSETQAWLRTVKRRLSDRFDFTPEGITHNLTVDLTTGAMLPIGESDWSQTQTRDTLLPYLVRALELLKAAGIDANGFTSPWVFGIKSEPEYMVSMVEAQRQVYGRDSSWYFLHMLWSQPTSRPWVAYQDERGRLVSIPANVRDLWWETIDDAHADPKDIARRLYEQTLQVVEAGGLPVVLTHWQSLFSNGAPNGLQALDEFGRLIAQDGRFAWQRCSEIAEMAEQPSNHPTP